MSGNPEEPVTLLRDGGMAVYPTQQEDAAAGSSIRIPAVSTSLGADFGEAISDNARLFAATREPIAGFLTGGSDGQRGFPKDIVEKWFIINDVSTKDPDPELDCALQKEFRRLKYKRVLTGFVGAKFLYGNTLLVGSHDDVNKLSVLETERSESAALMQLEVYPKINYSVFSKDTNQDSLRFGLPLVYQVNDGARTFRVHWTRCFEHVGVSILDLIWDDLTCGRNIRWGVGQWVFRVGGGFVVITFPKEIAGVPVTKEKLAAWAASKEWGNLSHRSSICIIDGMHVEFVGAQGAALNPEPFFDTNTKQISKATGIPKSYLEGSEAGAVLGSEKDSSQFFKVVSGEQIELEEVNRWVIDQLEPVRQTVTVNVDSASKSAGSVLKRMFHKVTSVAVKDQPDPVIIDYNIEWNCGAELAALDEARVNLLEAQANQTRLQYMTVDEVRVNFGDNLDPLPLGAGEVVLSLKAPVNPFPNSQNSAQQPQDPNNPNLQGMVNVDEHDSQLPNMRNLLKPIIKQVFDGHMTHDIALQQGLTLVEFYCNTEKERALEYVRGKFQNPTLQISPEQERSFERQKVRYTKDFTTILKKAERIAKAKLP
jgi:hypothetical protein